MSSANHKGKRRVGAQFGLFSVGILLNFAGYVALLNLQSSINIEEGVGADSVTATYATAAIFGVIFTPILLRHLGPKKAVIICELTYLTYILINYYPAAYTLIPAGIIVGVGEATMWPVMMLFCIHYARSYARYVTKSPESCVTEFIGIFYFIFQLSGVFGNLLNYGILYGGKSPIPTTTDGNSTTPSPDFERDLSICGKNDCQNPNETSNNINNYVPASQTLLYILIGVMAGLVIAAMVIHFLLLKGGNFRLEINVQGKSVQDVNEQKEVESENHEDDKNGVKPMFKTVKATLLHLIHPKQLLITPFALYSGLFMSFGFIELTRAFGSCMLGVEQVGLLAALLAGADAIMSYISCQISTRAGRHVTLFLGFCLDIGNYMICIFWIPTASSLWVVYVIFTMAGLIDGIWQPWVNELHGLYFPEEEEIAFTIWNLYVLVGIAWQTGWSTSLCVYEKIYFLIAFLCFSIFCYGISQYVYYKDCNKAKDESKHNCSRITKL